MVDDRKSNVIRFSAASESFSDWAMLFGPSALASEPSQLHQHLQDTKTTHVIYATFNGRHFHGASSTKSHSMSVLTSIIETINPTAMTGR